jgi:hypothetical protein
MLVSTAWLATGFWFRAVLVVQLAFYGSALGAWALVRRRLPIPRLLSVPFYVVLVAVAGAVGVLDTCRGRRFRAWEAAALSRGQSVGRT